MILQMTETTMQWDLKLQLKDLIMDMSTFLSPYELLNLRNFYIDNKAYFVILARSIEDVSEAVRFASLHQLALSIYSTGHEFQVHL